MNLSTLKPTHLRIILLLIMVLLIGIGVAGFVIGKDKISAQSVDTQQKRNEAAASESELSNLQSTQKQLEENKEIVTKASKIVLQSTQYKYQDDVIKDVSTIAARNGIKIVSFTFGAATTGSPSASTPAAAAPNSATTPAPVSAIGAAPAGVKPMSVTVAINNPVEYTNMLNFINALQQNLARIRIQKIGLSPAGEGSGNATKVTSDSLDLEVYVQQGDI